MFSKVAVHNKCCQANVDPSFAPLLPVAVRAYQDVFGDRLASVRLMGSVARGDAVAGHSDIDFLALVDRLVSDDIVSRRLAEHAARLHRSYPVVSAVDLDAVETTSLSAFQRFALASDSFVLYGRDELAAPVPAPELDRDTLVALVTPDPAALIAA